MLENMGTPNLGLRAAESHYLVPEGLTQVPSPSSLPTGLRLLQLLWPAGRLEFWKTPKDLLDPLCSTSLIFPLSSCLNSLCQIKLKKNKQKKPKKGLPT